MHACRHSTEEGAKHARLLAEIRRLKGFSPQSSSARAHAPRKQDSNSDSGQARAQDDVARDDQGRMHERAHSSGEAGAGERQGAAEEQGEDAKLPWEERHAAALNLGTLKEACGHEGAVAALVDAAIRDDSYVVGLVVCMYVCMYACMHVYM